MDFIHRDLFGPENWGSLEGLMMSAEKGRKIMQNNSCFSLEKHKESCIMGTCAKKDHICILAASFA